MAPNLDARSEEGAMMAGLLLVISRIKSSFTRCCPQLKYARYPVSQRTTHQPTCPCEHEVSIIDEKLHRTSLPKTTPNTENGISQYTVHFDKFVQLPSRNRYTDSDADD